MEEPGKVGKVVKDPCFQLWEQEVGGSNPPAPTSLRRKGW